MASCIAEMFQLHFLVKMWKLKALSLKVLPKLAFMLLLDVEA